MISRTVRFAFVLLLTPAVIRAQEPAATQPAPLLQQISDQTQALYDSVRPSLAVVRLPPPRWISALSDENFNKWASQLEPAVRERVEAELKASGARALDATISQRPATQPATQPGAAAPSAPSARLRVIQRPDGGVDLIAAPPASDTEPPVSGPISLALMIDDDGHLLVPAYIERESIGERGLQIYLGPQKIVRAKLVGSDQKTSLSVLKLEQPDSSGTPVRMAGGVPDEGSLVMVLLTNGESGQLLIWTGGLRESGAIITADGRFAGFARAGLFLASDQIRPIVDQLIRYGVVKRARLGVYVRLTEGVGGHPVVRIEGVSPNSPASAAGLKVGDIIVSVADSKVSDLATFAAVIAGGDGPTELDIIRDGKPMALSVNLKPQ